MYCKMMCNARKNQKGFTLVELMVVVVIIGILTAIAVPQYSNIKERSEQSAVVANLRTIEAAIMMHYAEGNGYPDAANELGQLSIYLQGDVVGPGTAEYGIATLDEDGKYTGGPETNNGSEKPIDSTRSVVWGEAGGEVLHHENAVVGEEYKSGVFLPIDWDDIEYIHYVK